MAEKVKILPRNDLASGKQRYPWEEWLDGSVWKLTPGEDFKANTFAPQIHAAAKARGISVRTRHEDGFIYLQADLNGDHRG